MPTILALLTMAATCIAQTDEPELIERFQFYVNCRPMRTFVVVKNG